MRIQIVSDLHLEFAENRNWLKEHPLQYRGDVLVLAGDTVTDRHRKKAEGFYSEIEKNFRLILSCMGNHEFYHGEADYAYPSYAKHISENHVKLNNSSFIFSNIKFIVSILWSRVPEDKMKIVSARMNDYHLICRRYSDEKVPLSVEDTNRYHALSVDYIESELRKEFPGKIIVVTHHLPSYQCVPPEYNEDELNCAFASKLDYLFEKYRIDYWISGHTHHSVDMMIHNTRCIVNPLGYVVEGVNENRDFSRSLVIEVN